MKRRILITGAAGFIGFHLCKVLIERNEFVIGLDNMNSYYDQKLKQSRLNELSKLVKGKENIFSFIKGDLINKEVINEIFVEYNPIVGLIIWICEGGTASLFEAKGDVAEPPNT